MTIKPSHILRDYVKSCKLLQHNECRSMSVDILLQVFAQLRAAIFSPCVHQRYAEQ